MEQNNQNSLNNQNTLNDQNNLSKQGYREFMPGSAIHSETFEKQSPVTQETAVTEPVEAETFTAESVGKNKPKKKSALIAIICVIIVALLAVGGYFAYNAFVDKEDTKQASAETKKEKTKNKTSDKALKEKEVGETTTIELYPDREVKQKDIEKFADTISERAQILGDAYDVEVDKGKISLTIAKDILGSTSAERINTMEMLVSRGIVGIGLSESVYSNDDVKGMFSDIEIVELDARDILKQSSKKLSEERYNMIDSVADKPIYALKVSVNNEGTAAFEKYAGYSSSDPVFTIMHDYDKDSQYNSIKFFGSILFVDEEDPSEIYVISQMPTYKKTAELMKHILETGRHGFGMVTSIADEPLWQTDEKEFGKNQVGSLKGEAIIAEYSPNDYTRTNNTEADYAKFETIIKERLDVLDIDYMFGTTGFDDKTYCIKVLPKDFAPDFFRLIFGDDRISIRSTFKSISGFHSLEVDEKDGQYVIKTEAYDTADEILGKNDIPDNIVYLVANDVTIASADITTMEKDGDDNFLYFKDFLCFGDAQASEYDKKVLELICEISEGEYVYFDGTFRFRAGDSSDKHDSIDSYDWKYNPLTEQDEAVFSIVEDLGHDIQKMVDERNMLVITIDEEIDESLPKDFLDAAKKVYEECNFDNGAYNKIQFVIKNETLESPANKFRLEISKDSFDGKMIITDKVSGPKFSKYWSEVYDITEEDTFFTERSW